MHVREPGRHDPRVRCPYDSSYGLDDDHDAEQGNNSSQLVRPRLPLHHCLVEDGASSGEGDHSKRKCEYRVDVDRVEEAIREKRAQHHECAVGHIEHAQQAQGQAQAEPDERVQEAQ